MTIREQLENGIEKILGEKHVKDGHCLGCDDYHNPIASGRQFTALLKKCGVDPKQFFSKIHEHYQDAVYINSKGELAFLKCVSHNSLIETAERIQKSGE